MKRNYLPTYTRILIILLATVSIASCSRKKNKWLNRNFHAMGAYYNIIYNGNLALELGGSDDGSHYRACFELTEQGEPICLSEYACRLANNTQTHVLHLNDFQPEVLVNLKKFHIKHDYANQHDPASKW